MNYTLTINLSDFIYHDDTFTLHTHNESMALKYKLDNADCRQHYIALLRLSVWWPNMQSKIKLSNSKTKLACDRVSENVAAWQ